MIFLIPKENSSLLGTPPFTFSICVHWKLYMTKEIIKKHNQWILAFRPVPFIGIMLVYDLLSKVIVGLFTFLFSLEPDKNSNLNAGNLLIEKGFETVLVETVFFAPILETILCQCLPIWFTGKFTQNKYILIGISTMVFTIINPFDDLIMLTIVFLGGVIFSFSFIRWRQRNIWIALSVTTIIHASSNVIAVGLALME